MKRYEFTVGGMRESRDGAWVRYDEASVKISKALDLFARSEIDRDKHLAAIRELTDRLAKVEKERDELKRGKSCLDCIDCNTDACALPCFDCKWSRDKDSFKPRDPSAAQGGWK